MSTIVLGFALGLNAAAAADAPTMNPALLAADRQYQQLIYEHRPVALTAIEFKTAQAPAASEREQSVSQGPNLAAQ